MSKHVIKAKLFLCLSKVSHQNVCLEPRSLYAVLKRVRVICCIAICKVIWFLLSVDLAILNSDISFELVVQWLWLNSEIFNIVKKCCWNRIILPAKRLLTAFVVVWLVNSGTSNPQKNFPKRTREHRELDYCALVSLLLIDWLIDWAWFYICTNTI